MAAPLLLGLGLDEFSMSATSILAQRKLIRGLSQKEMADLANQAINCTNNGRSCCISRKKLLKNNEKDNA